MTLHPALFGSPEGRDDDGDGRYNEDGPGGVDLNRNFPVGWKGPMQDPVSGRWPLSEPAAKALADLAMSRRTAAAVFARRPWPKLVM